MSQSAFDRLLYAMQLGFQQVDARMDTMEARLEASFSTQLRIAVGIILTGIAIFTAIIVALFIHYLG